LLHAAPLDRVGSARQNRDAVPALLAVPDEAVSDIAYRSFGEPLLRRLQLLQARDIGARSSSQRNRVGTRAVMPLTLKVAICTSRACLYRQN
jgi:hypothetical protein